MSVYKIYKDDLLYVGSTTNYKRRIRHHKHTCYNKNDRHYNTGLYKIIRDNGGWDAFSKEVIETNIEKDKLLEREEYYRVKLNANMNRQSCYTGKTKKEYMEVYNKNWRKNNKVHIKEYSKKYGKNRVICNCGMNLSRGSYYKHLKRNIHLKRVEAGLKIQKFYINSCVL